MDKITFWGTHLGRVSGIFMMKVGYLVLILLFRSLISGPGGGPDNYRDGRRADKSVEKGKDY